MHEMHEFLHGAPYAAYVELRNFYLFLFVLCGVGM